MNFTIRYLLVYTVISYFALIDRKTLNELRAIVSMPNLKMKFPKFTVEIVTVKADQKQAQQCYAESLKVAPYPPIREPAMPYPITAEGTQVMTMDEGPQIQALTVYQAIQGSEVDIDPQDETFNRGPKPIKELVQLQLGPKPGQCMQLCRDFTSQEHWWIANLLCRNADLFAWYPSNMPGTSPDLFNLRQTCYMPPRQTNITEEKKDGWRTM